MINYHDDVQHQVSSLAVIFRPYHSLENKLVGERDITTWYKKGLSRQPMCWMQTTLYANSWNVFDHINETGIKISRIDKSFLRYSKHHYFYSQ